MPIPEVASSAVAGGSVWWQPALSAVLGSIVGGLLAGTFALKAIAKQQQAQIRREFMLMRQKWVENMRELVPEIINTSGWFI